jgi:hypothetical protein
MKPSLLMKDMLAPPSQSRLAGAPVKLADVIQGAADRSAQSQRIDAYWDLCAATADYYLGLHEQQELNGFRASVPGQAGPSWQQAEAEIRIRVDTSLRAAVATQHRLASVMRLASNQSLPLPADRPHCGNYETRYNDIFGGRTNAEARGLHELLPLRFHELQASAAAVVEAEEWLQTVGNGLSANSDGTGVVKALELLALRRRAFVQIAKDYNRRIARYTELATPGPVDASQLVAMLIYDRNRATTASRPRTTTPHDSGSNPNVPPTNNARVPPHGRQTWNSEPQRTFVQDWEPRRLDQPAQDNIEGAIERTSAESRESFRQEKSVLVPRS